MRAVAAAPARTLDPAARARVAQLEQVFAQIAATRMRGVPVLNPVLRVQAVGFEAVPPVVQPDGSEAAAVLEGVLVTPWFMNLLRLPLVAQTGAQPGSKRSHVLGGQRFEFIAGHEDALGGFEACSLFSPMFEFADQAGAVATAREVLRVLRTPPDGGQAQRDARPDAPSLAPSSAAAAGAATRAPTLAEAATAANLPQAAVPSRRGFLTGRLRPGATP